MARRSLWTQAPVERAAEVELEPSENGHPRVRLRSPEELGAARPATWRRLAQPLPLAGVVLVLAALVVTVVVSAHSTAGGAGTTTITSPPSTGASSEPGAPGGAGASAGDAGNAGGALFVHVHGAVVSPGLYELAAGARVVDVVAAANALG